MSDLIFIGVIIAFFLVGAEFVPRNTDGRDLGVFGDPGVNVLQLNLALNQLR
jgi:hypothetical protein